MPVPHNTVDFSSLIGGAVTWVDPGVSYGSDPNMIIAVPGFEGMIKDDEEDDLRGNTTQFVPETERALCSFVVQQATPSDCAILLGVPYFDKTAGAV